MKKVILSLLAAIMVCAFTSIVVKADTAEDIADLKAQIEALQDKVADLEASTTAAPAASTGLPGNLTFHGYLRGRLHLPEDGGTGNTEKNSFSATELAFQPHWDSGEGITGDVHLWFLGAGAFYLESSYMTLHNLSMLNLPNSKLIVGKARNQANGITPHGGNRKISNYSLYEEAFTHPRITGLQLLNDIDEGRINWNIALFNGHPLSVTGRKLGLEYWSSSTNSVRVLSLQESTLDNNDAPAISTRFGGMVTPRLNMGLSGYLTKLEDTTDIALLTGTLGLTAVKARQYHLTLDFTYNNGPFVWQGEISTADIAGLDLFGAQTLFGYQFDNNDFGVIKFSMLNYDVPTTAATHSALWDKSQVTVSWKHNLNKKAWLQLEREFNLEDTPAGVSKVDNDLTFLEYMIVY